MVTTDTLEGTINGKVSYHYDVFADVLYLRLIDQMDMPSLGEETDDGMLELRTEETNQLIGNYDHLVVEAFRPRCASRLHQRNSEADRAVGQEGGRVAPRCDLEVGMRTGNGNNPAAPNAVGVRFERGRLIVILDDEREVSVPLSRYPTLQRARAAQRNDWRLIGRGLGFHWESLDLDLSVRGLVSGLPEVIPPPPSLQRRARATTKAVA